MRILLVPLGSAGDVHPFVGLGLALQARGHEVTLITGSYFEKLIRRVGLDFVAVGPAVDFEEELKNPDLWHPYRGFKLIVEKSIVPLLRPVYLAIAERYLPGETVVAAGSLAMGARVAQEKLGVPLATVHLQPSVLRSVHKTPSLPGLAMSDWWPFALKRLLYWVADALVVDPLLAAPVNAFRAELGLLPVRRLLNGWWNSPQRILGLFPEWYAPPQPDWPAQVRLTGFPLYDERGVAEPPAGLAEFLDAKSPPLVFTPGSANRHGHSFFAAAAEACRLLGRRGVLLTRFPEQIPAQLPEGVCHFAYVPFSQVLPRAAALVHHGGIGTTAQGLAAGIPQLLMPLAYDQPDNAAHLRRLGVGNALPPSRFEATAVARALDGLLQSADVAARCRDLAQRLRQAEPLEASCRAIEELAELAPSNVPTY